jgi:hypothetical protein
MPRIETTKALTATPTGTRPGFSSYRGESRASFLSQLIAERHHMAPQRVRRQAPVEQVLQTYDAGGKIAIRRLPPGYRMDIDA